MAPARTETSIERSGHRRSSGGHFAQLREGNRVSIPQLLVHDKRDNVGVVVVEGVKAGDELLCVGTEDDSDFRIVTKHDIPIGHKIALTDLAAGDTVIKYGEDIGRM